ncbi:type VI secretion system protein TssA [Cupriavidus basilensis]|uniref:type VI secretion system protein TssA n=1 Tax=Cupriavidus basilensis TaxID=68895 RepID=UPI00157B7459|nr:type VI secretion system protein TssA [Cupriavidus basilensis]NUA32095.1 type VI secretion system protein TssA [Cupriavidus basilensis]
MKAKTTTHTPAPKAPALPPIRFADLATPVDAALPCGEDLEYDAEFVVLLAKAAPRAQAQYGEFVAQAEPLNWTELERNCRRLLLRTKDIRLLTLFLRCRTRLDQAEGLRDGLALLERLLTTYPAAIHPRLDVDGEHDPALRANALAALADPEGLVADVREIPLAGNAATRLQIRDVERALGVPRAADALAPESVRQQLEALRNQGLPQMAAMDEACRLAEVLQRWCEDTLPGHAPDLAPLGKLLRLVGNAELAQPALAQAIPAPAAKTAPAALAPSPNAVHAQSAHLSCAGDTDDMPIDRQAALSQIHAARQWFERHEPSSPVSLLLGQAERLVGKRFDEVFQAIPPDLVQRWALEEEAE